MGASNDACWFWGGEVDKRSGYGVFTVRAGRRITAHRMALMLSTGRFDAPRDLFACHNCPGGDNPRCCNPRHLFFGTPKENTQDAVAKGRTARGGRHGRTRRTQDEVDAIRWLVSLGYSRRQVGRWFGATTTEVTRYVTREVWAA